MNINLGLGIAKSSKGTISTGLNKRGGSGTKGNVFDNDTDEEVDDPVSQSDIDSRPATSSRNAVNQALRKEQEVLRKRAQSAMAEADAATYDYDAVYDSLHPSFTTKANMDAPANNKKSRYIQDLLQTAQVRAQERDIIKERQIAKEQAAEEEANIEFRGKDKFVTSAYRRELQSRKDWQVSQLKEEEKEAANDVTKREHGMANFYGNFARNVAVGGSTAPKSVESDLPDTRSEKTTNVAGESASKLNFMDGFECPADDAKSGKSDSTGKDVDSYREAGQPSEQATLSRREQRERKVSEARTRYFQRKGISAV
jgi:coiled-coil domain-containing protein 55